MRGQVLIINVFMNRIFLIAAVLFFSVNVKSQQPQEYYIFIQETSRQPFYVRTGEVSHSSSATGHIILSRLRDSVYNFFIGFPKGRSPEQLFTITMNKKDHGYELRDMNGRWQLFDLQTLQLINPAASHRAEGQTVMLSDSYSALMSNVVDDSAVLYAAVEDTLTTDTVVIAAEVKAAADSAALQQNAVQAGAGAGKTNNRSTKKKQEQLRKAQQTEPIVRAEENQQPAKADTTTVAPAGSTKTPPPANDTIANTTTTTPKAVPSATASSVRDKRDIIRLITENVVEGKLMIYVDRSEPVSDTIRIVIPRP